MRRVFGKRGEVEFKHHHLLLVEEWQDARRTGDERAEPSILILTINTGNLCGTLTTPKRSGVR